MVAAYNTLRVLCYAFVLLTCAGICFHLGAGPWSYVTIVTVISAYVAGRQDAAPKWWED